MKQFYETYKDADEKLSPVVRQISWTNNLTIMSRSKSVEDLLEHRTDGTDAFDTLFIGAEKFPQTETSLFLFREFRSGAEGYEYSWSYPMLLLCGKGRVNGAKAIFDSILNNRLAIFNPCQDAAIKINAFIAFLGQ